MISDRSMIGSDENYEKHTQSTWEVLEEQWIEKVPNSILYLFQLNVVSKDCLRKVPDKGFIIKLGLISPSTHAHTRHFHLIHNMIIKWANIKEQYNRTSSLSHTQQQCNRHPDCTGKGIGVIGFSASRRLKELCPTSQSHGMRWNIFSLSSCSFAWY